MTFRETAHKLIDDLFDKYPEAAITSSEALGYDDITRPELPPAEYEVRFTVNLKTEKS